MKLLASTFKRVEFVSDRVAYIVCLKTCHKTFLRIPHTQLRKQVPIKMGLKVNRFRDINYCVEIPEMLRLTSNMLL